VRGMKSAAKSFASFTLLFLIRCYIIFLSPFFGGACRFEPSCSKYAYEAIARHGAWRGFLLAGNRLLRCNPFTRGGFDPVPAPERTATALSELPGHRPESVQ